MREIWPTVPKYRNKTGRHVWVGQRYDPEFPWHVNKQVGDQPWVKGRLFIEAQGDRFTDPASDLVGFTFGLSQHVPVLIGWP